MLYLYPICVYTYCLDINIIIVYSVHIRLTSMLGKMQHMKIIILKKKNVCKRYAYMRYITKAYTYMCIDMYMYILSTYIYICVIQCVYRICIYVVRNKMGIHSVYP